MLARAFLFTFLLLLTPVALADQVRLMKTGDVATMQVDYDLTHATHTIDILTYIWDPCSLIGKRVLEDLTAAAKRGVRVRLLIDAYLHDSDLRRNFSFELATRGIELRYFNVRQLPELMINRRVHAKMIVVDGKRYYAGGRNLADDYFDMEENNWLDRDVDVEGPSAKTEQKHFNGLWNSDMTTSENFGATANFSAWRAKCLTPSAQDAKLREIIANSAATILASQKTFSCRSVKTVIDDPHFLDTEGSTYFPTEAMTEEQYQRKYTSRAAVDFIAQANALAVENYTYVPEGHIAEAFAGLRAQKRKVEVFTNFNMDTGPLQFLKENAVATDNVGSEWIFGVSNKGSLEFNWAMTPIKKPAHWSIHSKAMVAGPSLHRVTDVFVGSYNLDPRSYGTNVETGVIVRNCPALAEDLKGFMDRLYKIYLQDQKCAECQVKMVVAPQDQLEATVGRQFFWQRAH